MATLDEMLADLKNDEARAVTASSSKPDVAKPDLETMLADLRADEAGAGTKPAGLRHEPSSLAAAARHAAWHVGGVLFDNFAPAPVRLGAKAIGGALTVAGLRPAPAARAESTAAPATTSPVATGPTIGPAPKKGFFQTLKEKEFADVVPYGSAAKSIITYRQIRADDHLLSQAESDMEKSGAQSIPDMMEKIRSGQYQSNYDYSQLGANSTAIEQSVSEAKLRLEDMAAKNDEPGRTFMGKAADIISSTPAYIGELGAGRAVAYGARKLAIQALNKYAQRASMRLALKGAAFAAGEVARTSTSVLPRVVGGIEERVAGTPEYDADGKLQVTGKQSLGKAAYNSFADNFIQNLSEISGGAMTSGLAKAGGAALRAVPKGRLLADFARAAYAKTFGNQSVKWATGKLAKAEIHSVPGEMLEERAGNLGEALLNTDVGAPPSKQENTLWNRLKASVPSLDQLMLEGVSFSMMIGAQASAMGAGHAIKVRREEARLKRTYDQAQRELTDALTPYVEELRKLNPEAAAVVEKEPDAFKRLGIISKTVGELEQSEAEAGRKAQEANRPIAVGKPGQGPIDMFTGLRVIPVVPQAEAIIPETSDTVPVVPELRPGLNLDQATAALTPPEGQFARGGLRTTPERSDVNALTDTFGRVTRRPYGLYAEQARTGPETAQGPIGGLGTASGTPIPQETQPVAQDTRPRDDLSESPAPGQRQTSPSLATASDAVAPEPESGIMRPMATPQREGRTTPPESNPQATGGTGSMLDTAISAQEEAQLRKEYDGLDQREGQPSTDSVAETGKSESRKEPWRVTPEEYDTLYANAGDVVDGRKVLPDVPNQSSIASSLDEYAEVKGIKDVPISAFEDSGAPKFYSKEEEARTRKLAGQIQESGTIKPLIVVYDAKGPYVLEGGHRFDALKLLGAKSFPAKVVIDEGSISEAAKKHAPSSISPKDQTASPVSEPSGAEVRKAKREANMQTRLNEDRRLDVQRRQNYDTASPEVKRIAELIAEESNRKLKVSEMDADRRDQLQSRPYFHVDAGKEFAAIIANRDLAGAKKWLEHARGWNDALKKAFTEMTGMRLPIAKKNIGAVLERWANPGHASEQESKAAANKAKQEADSNEDEDATIGANAEGQDIYKDDRGARFIYEDGVKSWQKVWNTPNGVVVQSPETLFSRGNTKFLTNEELSRFQAEGKADQAPAISNRKTPAKGTPERQTLNQADNTIFTDAQYAKDVEEMKRLLGGSTVRMGLDPQLAVVGARLAGYHVEKGVRKFADFAAKVKADFGDSWEAIKTHLHAFWSHAAADPKLADAVKEMDDLTRKDAENVIAELDKSENVADTKSEPDKEQYNGTRTDDIGRPKRFRPQGGKALADVPAEAGETTGKQGDAVPESEGSGGERGADGGATDEEGGDTGAGAGTGGEGVRTPRSKGPRTRTDNGPGLNYRITDADEVGGGGVVTKVKNNLAAITLLKGIEKEGRRATTEEQAILVKYSGWGHSPQIFDDKADKYRTERKALRELLTDEEWDAARRSTVNAHYTSPAVISAMWDAIKASGFTGGHVSESAMGIGHFLGLMPDEIAKRSKLHGIELDSLSGRIARQLYQNADIRIEGFQDVAMPDNYFDLFISNVPFANVNITDSLDRQLSNLRAPLHDYFFAKAIKKTRPGGLVVFITSRYSLDKKNSTYRQAWSELGANMVGAVRLPYTAFKGNAGTDVVTDIIVLQKREKGAPEAGESFRNAVEFKQGGETFTINQYFAKHPEHILGTLALTGTMYAKEGLNVEPKPGNLAQQVIKALSDVMGKADKKTLNPVDSKSDAMEHDADTLIAPENMREGSLSVKNGKLWQKQGTVLAEMPVPVKGAEARLKRIASLITVRDAARNLLALQITPEATEASVEKARKALNAAYDATVSEYGPMSKSYNVGIFGDDPDMALLLGLEHYDTDTGKAEKAEIFSKRTQFPRKSITHAETGDDALTASLNMRGGVDMPYMMNLTGKTEEAIASELSGKVFYTPEGTWEAAASYLSGNVRERLEQAQDAAKADKRYEANVKALEQVQPQDVPPGSISVRLGAIWVPASDYANFAEHITGRSIPVQYLRADAQWMLNTGGKWASRNERETVDWGTPEMPASEIIDRLMNNREIVVRKRDGDDKPYVDQTATAAARGKAESVKAEFVRWLWSEDQRTDRLVRKYNDERNNTIVPTYNGEHLTFPGMAHGIELRPSQKAATWRIVTTGNTLLAHVVGAGKTWTMAATAMELRRLGLAKKPVFVVPNHLIQQWPAEFMRLYPGARILSATPDDFTPLRRQTLMNRIATGDWDAVIVPMTSFEKMPLSPGRVKRFFDDQIAELVAEIENAKAEEGKATSRSIVKELEKAKERLDNLLARLAASWKKDKGPFFDDLGIDALFVDEAHEFKNLWFRTRMTRIPGVAAQFVQKSFDMHMKTIYLNEVTGGRGVIFATGTPITNSVAEMFTMQRYLQPKALESAGLDKFDAWASDYGDTVTDVEVSPEGGGFRLHTRFAKFQNLPELMQTFRSVADVQTDEMLNLPKPKLNGGKAHTVQAPKSDELAEVIKSLVKRAEDVRAGRVDPSVDNMLAITTAGRKAALDLRLLNSNMPDLPDSKVNQAVENIYQTWKETKAGRLTQLVWCDLGTPDTQGHNVYADVKRKLIQFGVPESDIAFAQENKTDAKRKKLFDDMNAGRIRILMASTSALGTGANVQKMLVAAHHLDAPWRPSDVEQRDGRILRPGNTNESVSVYRYVTKGSFDAYMWQTLETKARFISKVMTGDTTLREAEDVADRALTYAEVKAIASENPKIMEFVKLQAEVQQLAAEEAAHSQRQWQLRRDAQGAESDIERWTHAVPRHEQALKSINEAKKAEPAGTTPVAIRSQRFEKPGEAGKALASLLPTLEDVKAKDVTTNVGSIYGFPVKVVSKAALDDTAIKLSVFHVAHIGEGADSVMVALGDSPVGNIERIINALRNGTEGALESMRDRLSGAKAKLESMRQRTGQVFEKSDDLQAKRTQLEQLKAELQIQQQSVAGAQAADDTGSQYRSIPAASDVLASLPGIQRARIKSQFKKLTGSDHIEFVGKILDAMGQERAGRYWKGMVQIATGKANPKDTTLHEAEHFIEDVLLTETEKAKLRELVPDGEKRAEDFIRHVKWKNWANAQAKWPVRARAIASKLARMVRELFGKAEGFKTIQEFYRKASDGYYAKREARGEMSGDGPLYRPVAGAKFGEDLPSDIGALSKRFQNFQKQLGRAPVREIIQEERAKARDKAKGARQAGRATALEQVYEEVADVNQDYPPDITAKKIGEIARQREADAAEKAAAEATAKGKQTLREKIAAQKEKAKGQVEEAIGAIKSKFSAAFKAVAGETIPTPDSPHAILSRAYSAGMRAQRQKGFIRAAQDAIDAGLREIAKTYSSDPSKWQNMLLSVSDGIDTLNLRLGELSDEAAREALGKRMLREWFGDKRYLSIRQASRGDVFKTIEYLRSQLDAHLSRAYTIGAAKLVAHVTPDKLYNETGTEHNYREQWQQAVADVGIADERAKSLRQARGYLSRLRKEHAAPSEIETQREKVQNLASEIAEELGRLPWRNSKELFETLSGIRASSLAMQEDLAQGRRETRAGASAAVVAEITEAHPVLDEAEESGTPRRRGIFRNTFVDSRGDADTWSLTVGGGNEHGVAREVLYDALVRGNRSALTASSEAHQAFLGVLRAAGFSEDDMIRMAKDRKEHRVNGRKYLFTQAQLMELYALTLDEEARAKLLMNGFKPEERAGMNAGARDLVYSGDSPEAMAGIISDLVDTLTENQKRLVRAMMQISARMTEDGNDTARALFGYEKFLSPTHWPIQVDRTGRQTFNAADLDSAKGYRERLLTQMGMLKERVPHSNPLILSNVFDTFSEQVENMANFTHLSLPTLDALSLLNDPNVRTAMSERLGQRFAARMKEMIALLSGMKRHGEDWTAFDRWLAKRTRNIATSILGFRITSVLNNRIGGSILMANELFKMSPTLGTAFAARILPVVVTEGGENARIRGTLLANGYFYHRWKTDAIRVFANLPSDENPAKTLREVRWRRMQQAGMQWMANAEMHNAINAFKALTNHGYSEAAAVDAIERITRRTQNPSTALEETGWYTISKKSAKMGVFLPFFGQPTVAANILMRDALTLAHARRTGKGQAQSYRRLAVTAGALAASAAFSAALTVAMSGAARGGGSDDDDEKRRFYAWSDALGNLFDNLVPGSGRVSGWTARSVKRAWSANSFADALRAPLTEMGRSDRELFENLASRMWTNASRSATDIPKGISDDDWWRIERGVLNVVELAGQWTGAPTGGIVQGAKITSGLAGHPLGVKPAPQQPAPYDPS